MDASLMSRLKELEDENRRLKKMYAEERLKAEIVQEALQMCWALSSPRDGSTGSPGQGRQRLVACRAFGISEACYRFQARVSA